MEKNLYELTEARPPVDYHHGKKQEWTFAQTVGLYIALFCAVGIGMVILAIGIMWFLSILGFVR